MFDIHYEKSLLKSYKKGFKRLINERYNQNLISHKEKTQLIFYFDSIFTVKNIIKNSNHKFIVIYNIFLKNIRNKQKLQTIK